MEKNVLNVHHTFEEYPDYNLVVNNKSNYYYLETPNDNFIVSKMLDKATIERVNNKDIILINESYYDVITGSCVHKRANIYSIIDNREINVDDTVKIYPLNEILNINGNKKSYLNLEAVNELVNFNKTNQKIKK